MTLAERTRRFWLASYFHHQAPERDQRHATTAARQLFKHTSGKLRTRTAALLRKIDNGKHSSSNPA